MTVKPSLSAELNKIRSQEKEMRARWIRDEEGWSNLPARAWPEYQPDASEILELKSQLKECEAEKCADTKFDLATALLFNNIDADEGLKMYLSLAAMGDPRGMTGAGIALFEGYGVEIDEEKGAMYLQQASQTGFAQGLYELGILHYTGNATPYVEEDVAKAKELYEKAAALEHTGALYMLADMLMNGDGCEKDLPRAVGLLYKAAERGHRHARSTLLRILREKKDVQ